MLQGAGLRLRVERKGQQPGDADMSAEPYHKRLNVPPLITMSGTRQDG